MVEIHQESKAVAKQMPLVFSAIKTFLHLPVRNSGDQFQFFLLPPTEVHILPLKWGKPSHLGAEPLFIVEISNMACFLGGGLFEYNEAKLNIAISF